MDDDTTEDKVAATGDVKLIASLLRGNHLTSKEAANITGFKEKSASRNLRTIKEWIPGVEVNKTVTPHVYSYAPPLPATCTDTSSADKLEVNDVVSVALAAGFVKVFEGSHYASRLNELLNRLVRQLDANKHDWFDALSRKFAVLSGQEESLRDKARVLDDIVSAILRQKTLEFDYMKFESDEVEAKVIHPLSLMIYDAHLYLVGRYPTSPTGSTRSFRFSRITATRVVSPTFDYPPPTEYEPSRIFHDCIGVWAGAGEATEVVVKFHPKWTNHLKHHKWHHSQTTLETDKDGSTVIRLFVKLCPELERWVLGFADEAEVLRPPELRQKVTERMATATELYRDSD